MIYSTLGLFLKDFPELLYGIGEIVALQDELSIQVLHRGKEFDEEGLLALLSSSSDFQNIEELKMIFPEPISQGRFLVIYENLERFA